MKLRDDPVVASAMAGVLTQSNSFNLTGKIGRRPTDAELYMAHFMGVGGAAKLISNAEDNPKASGAQLSPNAAAANRSIFYDSTGRARSVSDVYSVLTSRYASAANSQATRSAIAAVGGMPSTTAVASAAPVENATFLQSFPDTRAAAPVTMASASVTTASASTSTNSAPAEPNFRSLFQFSERAQPVSSAVRELWGNSSSLTSSVASATATPVATATQVATATPVATATSAAPAAAASSSTPTPTVRAAQGLDLFSDRYGTFSSG
jgi:hypothetical protein